MMFKIIRALKNVICAGLKLIYKLTIHHITLTYKSFKALKRDMIKDFWNAVEQAERKNK